MSQTQTWDPDRYARNARFVSDLGAPVVELLAPRSGERILDLGCGDGALTKKLVEMGCDVIAVDASAQQIEAARKVGLNARVMDGENLQFDNEFDAVFSNAALHWMRNNPDKVISGVHRALKPRGRFVAEMGGYGCVAKVKRRTDCRAQSPWASMAKLPTRGISQRWKIILRASSAAALCQPTSRSLTARLRFRAMSLRGLRPSARASPMTLPAVDRRDFLAEVRETLRPQLCDAAGKWTADYVRLRFSA